MTKMLLKSELSTPDLCGLVADLMLKNKLKLVTAESCTGGMLATACTDLAGSSAWFERGFVTYSHDAKTEVLDVQAQVSVAVTGVAGHTGGSPAKPVGTVWFSFAVPGQIRTEKCHFDGDRAAVRAATVRHAFTKLVELLG